MTHTPLSCPWLADVSSAVRASMRAHSAAWVTPGAFAAMCRYRFLGQAHPIAGLVECQRRGWGACADAAAVFAARAVLDGDDARDVWFFLELAPSMASYAHLRVWSPSGGVVDPYARRARGERRRVDGMVSLFDVQRGARAALSTPGLSVRAAVKKVSHGFVVVVS